MLIFVIFKESGEWKFFTRLIFCIHTSYAMVSLGILWNIPRVGYFTVCQEKTLHNWPMPLTHTHTVKNNSEQLTKWNNIDMYCLIWSFKRYRIRFKLSCLLFGLIANRIQYKSCLGLVLALGHWEFLLQNTCFERTWQRSGFSPLSLTETLFSTVPGFH